MLSFAQSLTKRQIMTPRNLVLASMGVVLVAATAFALQEEETTTEAVAARPLPVAAQTVQQIQGVEYQRHYTGEVVARRRSQLGFELAGLITEVLVDDGDRVKQGDRLASLDTALLKTQQAEVEAQRDAAKALLAEMVAGPRAEKIALARAQVTEQAARAKFWQQERDRQTELFERGTTGRKEYLDAVAQSDAASAAEQVAQENLNELLAGTRAEQLAAQRATVARLEAAVRQFDVQLSKSNLLAPFDGSVALRMVDDGEVVAAGHPVIDLIEDSKLEARVGVPVRIIDQVNVGQEYELLCQGRKIRATLQTILPAVDLSTRTRTLVLEIKQGTGAKLAAGQVTRLTLSENVKQSGYWVPMEAVVKGNRGLWAVYALEVDSDQPTEALVEQRVVEVLHSESDRVFVRGLLSDGDLIVASGANRIVPGQRVAPQSQHVAKH